MTVSSSAGTHVHVLISQVCVCPSEMCLCVLSAGINQSVCGAELLPTIESFSGPPAFINTRARTRERVRVLGLRRVFRLSKLPCCALTKVSVLRFWFGFFCVCVCVCSFAEM